MPKLFYTALLSVCLPLAALCQSKLSDTTGGYKLIWADEFNKEGAPDSTNWKYENGFARNHELQWYQPQNAVCHKGLLVIEVKKETRPNPNYVAGSNNWKTNREQIEYTSSSMNTSGRPIRPFCNARPY